MKKLGIMLMIVCLIVGMAAIASAQSEGINRLEFKDDEITVWVDGDKEIVSDGENVDKAKPGSDIKIKVELDNKYEDRDMDIEDVEIEIVGDSLDDDEDDWEEDDEIDEIRGTRDDDVSFRFELPLDVEDGEHTIIINVNGDCANSSDNANNLCEDEFEFTLEVEKEKHELLIEKAVLEPQLLSCGGSTTLDLKIWDIGREDEDDILLEVKNNELDINFREEFDLQVCPDDDCSLTKSFEIRGTEEQDAGNYPLAVKLTYDEGDETLTKNVNLDLEECVVEEVEEEVVVLGCTDATALNYNSAATEDDDSCEYEEEEEEITEVPEAIPITGAAVAPLSVEKIAVTSLIILGVVLVVVLAIFLAVKATKKL